MFSQKQLFFTDEYLLKQINLTFLWQNLTKYAHIQFPKCAADPLLLPFSNMFGKNLKVKVGHVMIFDFHHTCYFVTSLLYFKFILLLSRRNWLKM